mmetsp:Transcript_18831/g.46181  ORF Transcript_18831/g.46181 Transcript_18831/m.46181 type:complete len:149 (-) Transcript_18831:208-654(-)|eukprot:CAMPEP_0114508192 /NCGR_PEP_ID=MMETSP0109-20121206/12454_1 /TAXON_ID=29199 /ORGANISM="Chlorarachnion reptans, Strain CCCM449" /LENGTH=148 /DNA_ID=CAMNT_0001687079 /DNA_START=236 /DNA_END=682 /DNA_ORIENTATION=-
MSTVRRIAGRLVRGIKPEYLMTYNQSFVDEFLKPRMRNRRKCAPKLGARQVAELRKEVIMAGGTWPYEKQKRPQALRITFKGHKHKLSETERKAMIEENLKDMDEKIAAHKKALRDARPRKGTFYEALNLHEIDPYVLEKEGGKKKKK